MKLSIAAILATASYSSAFTAPAARARFAVISAISDPEITSDGFIIAKDQEEIDVTAPVMASVSPDMADVQASAEPTFPLYAPPPQPVTAPELVVEPPDLATPKATVVDTRKQIQP